MNSFAKHSRGSIELVVIAVLAALITLLSFPLLTDIDSPLLAEHQRIASK